MKKTLLIVLPALLWNVPLHGQIGSQKVIIPFLHQLVGVEPSDWDNDGDLDLVVAATEYHRIGWYENLDGVGNYGSFELLSAEAVDVRSIKLLDLDQDGDEDILALLAGGSRLAWLENLDDENAPGSPVTIFNSLEDAHSLQAADFDHDDDIDLVVTEEGNGNILYFENLGGQPSFGTPILLKSGLTGRIRIEIADMDNDLDLDVVYATDAMTTIRYLKNDQGQGIFNADQSIAAVDLGVIDFWIADMDGDEFLDVLIVPIDQHLFWRRNFGPGLFIQSFPIPFTDPDLVPLQVRAHDLDDDQDLDVIVLWESPQQIRWYENQDGLGLSISEFPGTITIVGQFVIAGLTDLNDNGLLDLLVTLTDNSEIKWYEKSGAASSFSLITTLGNLQLSNNVVLADLDGDGDQDLLCGRHWLENQGEAQPFSQIHLVHQSFDIGGVGIGDLDADGDLDLVGLLYNAEEVAWYENDGGGNFTQHLLALSGFEELSRHVTVGDFDNDKDLDIIVASDNSSTSNPNGIGLFRNLDGQGNFSALEPLLSNNTTVDGIEAGDIDNDGDLDLLVLGMSTPTGLIRDHWLENSGSGFFTPHMAISYYTGVFSALGDLNNDGFLDITFFYGDEIRWGKFNPDLKKFEEFITAVENPGESYAASTLRVGDIDLDGDLDLLYSAVLPERLRCLINVDGRGLEWEQHTLEESSSSGLFTTYLYDMEKDGDLDVFRSPAPVGWYENLYDNPKLIGAVFHDENNNGLLDAGEIPLYDREVTLDPAGLHNWNNLQGQFSFAVDTGQYTLSCQPGLGWQLTSDSIVDLIVSSTVEAIVHNFGLIPAGEVSSIAVDIAVAPTRCGFQVPLWLNYCNYGNLPASGFVSLALPSVVTSVEAVPPADSIEGNVLYWFFDGLLPTYTAQIELLLQMPGPDMIGDTLFFLADAVLTGGAASDHASYSSVLSCAYDPNDKLVDPSYPGYEEYALLGDEFVYTIRFQNTGTDTAFQVRIVDHLDPNLDWSSLEVVATSHPCQTSLNEYGKLLFRFDDILLPDSTTNEPASHGFVRFGIRHLPDLAEGMKIRNQAAILFDFNPPIVTNSTSNILVSELPLELEVQSPCEGQENGSIAVSAYGSDWLFNWSDGQTGAEATELGADTISLVVTDPQGKFLADTTLILTATDSLTATFHTVPATNDNSDGTATVEIEGGTPPYGYLWSTEPPQTGSTAFNLPAGSYTIAVADSFGCTLMIELTVDKLVVDNTEYPTSECCLQIAPNPSAGLVRFSVNVDQVELNLRMIDPLGRLIAEYPISKEAPVLIESLLPGSYLVELQRNREVLAREWLVIIRD
ncbi:MAG: VCBS repeat-containing protein [Saprospiraceae bacterium]|nr:VCBS repeat-containing protein [Saprospiraceae bacterium]